MIEVSVQKENISVTGHAGYAPSGQDIVCAGVSTLTQALIASIENLTEDRPCYIIAPGIFKLKTKDLSEQSKFLVDSFFVGVCGMADAYPNYIQIV
ncbi:MAG TPA: ribosomal-processing cysteine protease Prp [Candidatus Merdenecus merdavium]|nr:ribosomal-processing cysteine protease Prp [Candidatus Merdenecus merdavium]